MNKISHGHKKIIILGISFLVFLVCIVLFIFQTRIQDNNTDKAIYRLPDTSRQMVNIIYPRNGDIIEDEMIVEGMYSSDVVDDIWVIIWPEKACGRGWPQFEDLELSIPSVIDNGNWSVYCYFGGPSQGYDLAVYTAPTNVSDSLKNLYRKIHNKNFTTLDFHQIYKGFSIPDIPEGLAARSNIFVIKVSDRKTSLIFNPIVN